MPQPTGKSFTVDHAIQKSNESSMEAACRKEADFPKFEDQLNIERFSLPELGLLSKATGLLGSLNPFGKQASASENEVWLLDNTAYWSSSSSGGSPSWQAEFVACYFKKGRKDLTKLVSRIADAVGLDGKVGDDAAVRQLIAERLQPFVSAIAPARTIDIKIPADSTTPMTQTLGPSNSNGISSQLLTVGQSQPLDGTTITCENNGSEFPTCANRTRFAGPEGWAIVSDIDDTIKVTQTSNPIGILRTTFTEIPRTTEGMQEFYKTLDASFGKPAWFYLSASPYNLYPFLHEFLHEHYLPGTIILRDASWMFFGGLLQSLTQGVKEYKTSRIDKIHGWIPKRKLICVGDSTQSDPEVYAEMYNKYPGWIKAIFIRKVVDIPFMEMKNSEDRFTKAFKDVPANVWKIFITPDELTAHVNDLTSSASTSQQ